jgi:hypothetical protein
LPTTQCTHVVFGAFGSGASGSSTMSAKLFVPSGSPRQASGGEMSFPSHVCLRGMPVFGWNADDSIRECHRSDPSHGDAP